MRRAVAVFLIATLVLSPLAAAGLSGSVAADAPSGFVCLPNDNITEDWPGPSDPPVMAERFEDCNTLVAEHAETTELIVTTIGRAKQEYMDGDDPVLQGNGFAVVIQDPVHDDGRRIAFTNDVMHDAAGFVIDMIHGVHENDGLWRAGVKTSGSYKVFEIPHFSTNTVTFGGDVSINANPATDGTSYTYEVSDLDSVEDPSVNFTGHTNTEWDNQSTTGISNGGTFSADVAGNMQPTGPSSNDEPQVIFTGNENDRNETWTTGTHWDNGLHNGTATSGGDVVMTDGYHNITEDEGDGADDFSRPMVGDTSSDTALNASIEFVAGESATIDQLNFFIGFTSGSDYDFQVDVYIASGGIDTQASSGTKVDTWNPGTFSTGTATVNLDTNYDVTSGNTYHIDLVTNTSDTDGTGDQLQVNTDGSAGAVKYTAVDIGDGTLEEYANVDIDYKAGGDEPATYNSSLRTWTNTGKFQNVTFDISTPGTTSIDATIYNDAGDSVTFTDLSDDTTKDISSLADSSQVYVNVTFHGSESSQATLHDIELHNSRLTSDPSVDIDQDGTDEASHTGTLKEGETVTKTISTLDTGHDTWDVSTNMHTVDVKVELKERTETVDPSLEVNGNWLNHSGTLSDGTSSTKTGDSAWLFDGKNWLNLTVGSGSLSADAPTPSVQFNYTHTLEDDVSVSYDADKWQEFYNVSHTFASHQNLANLTIPFDSSAVTEISTLEKRINTSGGWTSIPSSEYTLSGTTLTVEFGELDAQTTVEVRAHGSKVAVNNGSITILEATPTGQDLATEIKLDSWNHDSYIQTDGAESGNRLHHVVNTSWTPDDKVLIKSDGTKKLKLPQASDGDTARVETAPVDVSVDTNEVKIEIVDSSDQPELRVRSGGTAGDTVTFTYYAGSSGTTYLLYSKTHDIVRDSGSPSSPLDLVDDDDSELLKIKPGGSSDGGGADGGADGGAVIVQQTGGLLSGVSVPILLLGGVGVLAVGYIWIRSRGEGTASGAATTLVDRVQAFAMRNRVPITIVGILAVGVGVASGAIPVGGQVALIGGVLAVPLLTYLILIFLGAFSFRIWIGITALAAFLGIELISQQSFLEVFGATLQQVAPIAVLVVGFLAWQVVKAWRDDTDRTIVVRGERK